MSLQLVHCEQQIAASSLSAKVSVTTFEEYGLMPEPAQGGWQKLTAG